MKKTKESAKDVVERTKRLRNGLLQEKREKLKSPKPPARGKVVRPEKPEKEPKAKPTARGKVVRKIID